MENGVVSGSILYDNIRVIQGGGDAITFQSASGRFLDVAPHNWFYAFVESAAEQGLMLGNGSGRFEPDQTMTRGMMAQTIYNMAGRPEVTVDGSLTDVPAEKWYAPAVNWAYQAGVIQGYGDGHCGPDDTLDRQQAVSFLYSYARQLGRDMTPGDLSAFPDAAAVSEWAGEAMGWAVTSGVMNGTGAGLLEPAAPVTRAQMAALLIRFVK